MLGATAEWTDEQVLTAVKTVHRQGLLDHSDELLACGAAVAIYLAAFHSPSVWGAAAGIGVLSAGWGLYRRVCPVLPSAAWWTSTASVVDGLSVKICGAWGLIQTSAKHLSADQAGVLEIWKPLVSEAVEMVVMNRTAGLSAADTGILAFCVCRDGRRKCNETQCAACGALAYRSGGGTGVRMRA